MPLVWGCDELDGVVDDLTVRITSIAPCFEKIISKCRKRAVISRLKQEVTVQPMEEARDARQKAVIRVI